MEFYTGIEQRQMNELIQFYAAKIERFKIHPNDCVTDDKMEEGEIDHNGEAAG